MFRDTKRKTKLEILEEAHGKKYTEMAELACKIMRLEGRIQIDNARQGKSTGHLVQTILNYKDVYEDKQVELDNLMESINREKGTTDLVVHGSDI